MKRITGTAIAALAMALAVPAMAQQRAAIEAVHAKAAEANTAAKHAAVAREYRLQAEAFGAKAAEYEREAAQATRGQGAIIHKWPGMATRGVANQKAKAVEARRAQRESLELADHHIRLAVEAQAENTVIAGN